jgi:hypothetical protein
MTIGKPTESPSSRLTLPNRASSSCRAFSSSFALFAVARTATATHTIGDCFEAAVAVGSLLAREVCDAMNDFSWLLLAYKLRMFLV